MTNPHALPWLTAGHPFPDASEAWGTESDAPGLLAMGGELSTDSLVRAYSSGIFPWFSQGQPILWWSPDPRMVLQPEDFKLHRSLKKKILRFAAQSNAEIQIDTAFRSVIESCATAPRHGQSGTWILPDMVDAYVQLNRSGYAHSVETWIDGKLAGGLYCVAIGRAVFGESMFTRVPDASKTALAALVALCLAHGVTFIDCQQNTRHLASLGAREIPRTQFLKRVATGIAMPAFEWKFSPLYWSDLLQTGHNLCDGP